MECPAIDPLRDEKIIPMPQRIEEQVRFNRFELAEILGVYGRHVGSGEWRDYAIQFGRERAVFAILRHTGEMPLYRIEKDPALAGKQGLYALIALGGRVLKRGHSLAPLLKLIDK